MLIFKFHHLFLATDINANDIGRFVGKKTIHISSFWCMNEEPNFKIIIQSQFIDRKYNETDFIGGQFFRKQIYTSH